MRVERARLADDGLGDAWMAVPDDRHVVVRVEHRAAVGLVEPDAFAAHDVNGTRVRKRGQQRTEGVGATPDELVGRHLRSARAKVAGDGVEPETVEVFEQRP